MINDFTELGLSHQSLQALRSRGFTEPTPIQTLAIPVLLGDEKDIVGLAGTGTGKTAAFSLPLLEHIQESSGHIQAVILTPTRELTCQVADEIESLRGNRSLSISRIYGGRSIVDQIRNLRQGADIVVGTPGRIIDHIRRRTVDFSNVRFLVIDEADEMLDMGFIDEIEEILNNINRERRTILFSATMNREVLAIAKRHMGPYQVISVEKNGTEPTLTDQVYLEVNRQDCFEALCRIISSEIEFYGLVFCRTKKDVDELSAKLIERGYNAAALHGDISQGERERTLQAMRSRIVRVLVATDVAARGIDIVGLTHVINYSLPDGPDAFIHRTGRTGRAGNKGTAITIITPGERRKVAFIQKVTGITMRKGHIPQADDIVRAHLEDMKKHIHETISDGSWEQFRSLAQDVLSEGDPVEVLGAMLQVYHHDRLSRDKYKTLRDPVQKEEPTRQVIVNRGRSQGMTPRIFRAMIRKATGIPLELITGMEVGTARSSAVIPSSWVKKLKESWSSDNTFDIPFEIRPMGKKTQGDGSMAAKKKAPGTAAKGKKYKKNKNRDDSHPRRVH